MKKLLTGALAVGTLTIGAFLQANPAEAITFGFQNITNNITGDATIGNNQLFVDVTEYAPNQVSFLFGNTGPAASSITDIYFENRNAGLLGTPAPNFIASSGVDFSLGANPSNLPGANNATPAFQASTTSQFTTDSNPPAQPNGINPNETLQIIYNLANGINFNDIIAALQNPSFTPSGTSLRIGIHVQGFASGGSESFVNNTTPIPTPALLPGAIGMGIAALRRKKREQGLEEATQET